ncbi:MAG: hypothetical protein KAR00_02620 [Candidatus Pacebacteria bacterium]|nr:hypothetical protein [Candidatus Paceibacterota bacterium]
MKTDRRKTQRIPFSAKCIMTLDEAGVPSKIIVLKETPLGRRVHKKVTMFLKEKRRQEKLSEKYIRERPIFFKR